MKTLCALLLLLASSAYSCALCNLYTPTAHVQSDFLIENEELKGLHLKWYFSSNFTLLTLDNYDLNANGLLDENETRAIRSALLDYLKPRAHLVFLKYYDLPLGKSQRLRASFAEQKLEVVELSEELFSQIRDEESKDESLKSLCFEFDVIFERPLKIFPKRVLSLNVEDLEGYFNFSFLRLLDSEVKPGLFASENPNLNVNYFEFTDLRPKIEKPKESLYKLLKEQGQVEREDLGFLKSLFASLQQRLKVLLLDGSLLLCIFAFIYGLVHAAGPGHGKLIAASYFSRSKENGWIKALAFSMKIGFFHVFGAFVFVLIGLFALENLAELNSQKAGELVSKISGLVVILIACILLYKSAKAQKSSKTPVIRQAPKSALMQRPRLAPINAKSFSATKESTALAFFTGIIPCPGTVVIFILAYNLNRLGLALLGGLCIAFGMSVVIFAAAALGQGISSVSLPWLRRFLDLLAIICLFGIGTYMCFFASFGAF